MVKMSQVFDAGVNGVMVVCGVRCVTTVVCGVGCLMMVVCVPRREVAAVSPPS